MVRLLPLASIVVLFGCGKSSSVDQVSGKVTLDGQPVGGMIHFIGTDGKASARIAAGGYMITKPPLGQVKVVIEAMAGDTPGVGPGGIKPPPSVVTKLKDLPVPKDASASVAPPKKYASPDNGLTYEVKAGSHIKDFELTK